MALNDAHHAIGSIGSDLAILSVVVSRFFILSSIGHDQMVRESLIIRHIRKIVIIYMIISENISFASLIAVSPIRPGLFLTLISVTPGTDKLD